MVRTAFHVLAATPTPRDTWGCPTPLGRWSRNALSGCLTELSGIRATALLTLACTLVLDAQQQGEPAAWVTRSESTFFPPDVAASGIDLNALVVVRIPTVRLAARAADTLARSGAFGLIVLDLGIEAAMPVAFQARLVRLARAYDIAVLCLTEKRSQVPSLGSLIAMRGEARRRQDAVGRFWGEIVALKDKRRGPGWTFVEEYYGPTGLC